MNIQQTLVAVLGLIVVTVAAQPYDNDMYRRGISYVTDLPADAYKDDDRVTIIIAATVGGVAGLVLLSSLIFALIRRKKRGPIAKTVENDDDDDADDKYDEDVPLRQPRYIQNMQEPSSFGNMYSQPPMNVQMNYPTASDMARTFRESRMPTPNSNPQVLQN
ncbi:hypothetical protein IWW50_003402 [Coemansia erecta]|nr:hypothetical protein IWW50_003402 [Coemansia erecta]